MKQVDSGEEMSIVPRKCEEMSNIPKKYWKLAARAREGNSRKDSIRFFCLQCCGYSSKEVKECTAEDCPLYDFRLKG